VSKKEHVLQFTALVSLVLIALGPVPMKSAAAQATLVCEDFESGFTPGERIGTHADWYDGGNGPVVTDTNGVAGSVGLAAADSIYTWTAHPFDWNDPDFQGVTLQQDFQTDGSGHLDDDRIGWMTTDSSTSSSNIFGLQLDPGGSGYNIEGYWDGISDADRRPHIVDLPALSANTWYRFQAEITKLSATSASIDVTLTELDGSGDPAGVVASGSIADTSALGDDAPNSKYFTGTIWPAYKNYTTAGAPADNACHEVVTGAAPSQHDLTVSVVGSGSVDLDPSGGTYDEGTSVTLSPVPAAGWSFDGWSGPDAGDLVDNGDGTWSIAMDADKSVTATFSDTLSPDPAAGWSFDGWSGPDAADLVDNGDGTWSIVMDDDKAVTATFVELQDAATGDVIIAGFQSWNSPSGQNPGEFVSLFNTTDQTISLENMELISRVDNDSDGVLEVDWQLAADLTGKTIAPYSFFLIAESGVAAPGGVHDVETDMDLATGEGGYEERAIGLEVVIDGTHMDYVLYGRDDGSSPAGEIPDGDLPFDGSSWPRNEVIRNTRGDSSFQEGVVRRLSAADLHAGYDVEGYYADEDALGDGYPNGVWASPHSETDGSYEARNSTSPAVPPPLQHELVVSVVGSGSTLSPDPAAGWSFDGWSGPDAADLVDNGDGTWSIVMDDDKAVTATFVELPPNSAPDQPVLVQPLDGAVDVSTSPTLEVTASDPDLDALDVTFYGREVGAGTAEDFTVIVLPDTQKYSDNYPAIYADQTEWIVANKDALNIIYVAHEGDIVDHASDESEWINADAAMSLLEDPVTTGLADGIPYGVVPGNHDEPTTYYNQYFGVPRFQGRSYYGDGYPSGYNDNSYTLFSAGGMDFIVINLEYTPASGSLDWADTLLQTYSDRRAIVVSHYILDSGGTFSSSGQQIYDALKDNPNLFLMLCGHIHAEARRTDVYSENTVHTLLADYQDYPSGGNGYLRILEFSPANDEISITTYSPWLDEYETDASSEFVLSYDMDGSGPFVDLGTVSGTPSGNDASVSWPGLSLGTSYEWYADVSDSALTTAGPLWSFTTTSSPPTGWVAYNDNVYDPSLDGSATDPNGQSVHYIAPNVTTYSIGDDSPGPASGELLNFDTGAGTGVVATLSESGGVIWQPDVSSNWYGGYDTALGTDARNTFGGIADMTGVTYYGSTGWYVDLTFTGLDPAKQYTFATSASRANPAYDRSTIYTISDVDAATNASTPGTQEYLGDPLAVWFNTGDNHDEGYVARWAGIDPGADGSFTVRAEAHPSAEDSGRKAYAFDVFMLQEEDGAPPPPQHDLTVNVVGNGSVDLDPPGGTYDEGTVVTLTAAPEPGWIFDSWSGDLGGSANPETLTMDAAKSVTATFVELPSVATGDVIIAGLQSWNSAGSQNPAEFVSLFNTTDQTISLENMELISRVDNDSDGVLEVDWQLAADLAGKTIAPYSFFLIAESDVAAPGGVHDVETDMDLATGEGGSSERAIGLELVINGTHMDYVLYGRHDGSDTGANPDGDLPFDGSSWPRSEVIRNTRGTSSFQEGVILRQSAVHLHAGYDVEGYYTDEDALGDGYPNGIWTSPHDNSYDSYQARNSTSPAVPPPPPQQELTVSVVGNGSVDLDPSGGSYDEGALVTLSPVPDPGWVFDSWSGPDVADLADNGDGTWSIVMDAAKSVTATFVEGPPPPPPVGVCEDFESGFTLGQPVGTHAEWFDGGGGPDVNSGIGLVGSNGLAPANNIFTWTEHPFDWNDPAFVAIDFQMDFQTDSSGEFDDDRIGWMITDSDIGSTNLFGVQLDHSDGGIVTYWRDSSDTRIQTPIVALSPLSPNTWYRFQAEITKLTPTSARIDVSLVELDAGGVPTGTPFTGTVDDTSLWPDGTPDTKYFTASSMWPAYKNYDALQGAADNACFDLVSNRFAFVVVTDPHTSDGQAAVEDNLQQVRYLIDNPTTDMPAPEFMVITGDFPHLWQTEASIDSVVGTDFLWYPVIGNHEVSDDIDNFYEIRDTMVPTLPYIVDYGPTGSVNTSYSWDYGNAHFVAINVYWDGTTDPGADSAADGDIPPELRSWIDADLAALGGTHNFAFVHEPAYPDHRHVGDSLDKYPANRDAFVTTLNDRGVETLFAGHTHYYEHDVDPEFPLGNLHQVTNGYLRTTDGASITYVLVDGTSTTYKVYLRTGGSPFTLHEEWTISTEPPTEPPAAPTDLSATAASYAQIGLTWTDNANNEDNFEIERSTAGSGGPFSLLTTVPANTEAHPDTGLTAETEYCYRVRATNSEGDSDYTDVACATTPEEPPTPPGVCESFESGFTLGADVGDHADWFDGADDNGSNVESGIGVAGSNGVAGGEWIYTWTAQPFSWNAPDFLGVNLQMDFQTDSSGEFDDDRVGWMIADDTNSSDNIFGVQMDPGGSGQNIEAYWDGDSFGDDGGRTSIADLPALSPNAWYRLRAEITKLTATSAQIDVTLTALDAAGNPGAVVASGSIPNTALLPDTAGNEIPNPGYFTAATIWPAYKNYQNAAGAADNPCYEVVTGPPPPQHTLTVSVVGNGSVDLSPPGGTYNEGTLVTLTASPDPGWIFDSWSGDLSGSVNPESITMDAAKMVTATFVELPPLSDPTIDKAFVPSTIGVGGTSTLTFILTNPNAEFGLTGLNFADGRLGPNTGDIAIAAPLNLGGTCGAVATDFMPNLAPGGTAVSLVSGVSLPPSGSCTITVDVTAPAVGEFLNTTGPVGSTETGPGSDTGADTLTVLLNPPPQHDLTVNVVGNGSVALDPLGGIYAEGTVVTLTPTPGSGWTFDGWSGPDAGDLVDNGDGTWSIAMDAAKSVTATFVELPPPPQYDLTVNVVGNGSVALDPPGGTYDEGTPVTLTPTPGSGWTFDGWSGPDAGDLVDNGDGTWSIAMDAAKSVTATFVEIPPPQHDLTVNVVGSGSVVLDPPGGTYDEGTPVTLTAVPEPGWAFDGWSGDASGSANPTTVTMDGDKTVTATFAEFTGTPAAPVPLEPAHKSYTNDNTPTFTWEPAAGGVTYQVQCDDSKKFKSPDEDVTLSPGEMEYTASPMSDGRYYWRVRAMNSLGEPGPWSKAYSFSIDSTPPPLPTLKKPADNSGTTDTTPKLQWNKAKGASEYQLQVSPAEDFGTTLVDVPVAKNKYALSAAEALGYGTYYWRVRATDAAGNQSDWSATYSFSVTILKSPVNESFTTNRTPTLQWNKVKGALGYRLQVADDEDFTSLVVDVDTLSSKEKKFTINTVLAFGPYYWRMQVLTASGWSAWMPAWQFMVTPPPPPAPVLVSPPNKSVTADDTPTFTWNASVDGETYQIQVDDSKKFKNPEEDVTLAPGVLTHTASPLIDGRYRWRVRAINSHGVPGKWSKSYKFTLDTP